MDNLIREKIDKNREEINNLLNADLPLDIIYTRIRMLASQNERLLENLKDTKYLIDSGHDKNISINHTKNNIKYLIGESDNKNALIVALIENKDVYLLTKDDAKEMLQKAKSPGIKTVSLMTNYGLEVHSKMAKDLGFFMSLYLI